MQIRFGLATVLLSFFVLAGAAPCTAAGQAGANGAADSDSSRFDAWTYKDALMGLYRPGIALKSKPVVMFLHGCNNDPVFPAHWIISALNDIEPTVVFLPTAPETPNTQYPCADWGGTYDSKIRSQLQNALHELDSLIDRLGLDGTRVYLYGESMGGEGVYRLLADFPTRFAGAIDVAGYTVNKGAAQMAKTPLWIVIGSDDQMSPVDSARAIHASILQAGGTSVKYTEYPDLGHVPAIENARTDTSLLRWLMRQKRSTGLIPGRDRSNLASSEAIFSVANGILRFSSALPAGTRVRFADLQGNTLLIADAGTNGTPLPQGLAKRLVVWQAQHSRHFLSGRTMLLP